MIGEWIAAVCLLLGGLFALLAAVGLLRMPDLFTRLQAASKATTFGVGVLFVGVAIHFDEFDVTARALLVFLFVFVTLPIGAQMIARAGYDAGVPVGDNTLADELGERRQDDGADWSDADEGGR